MHTSIAALVKQETLTDTMLCLQILSDAITAQSSAISAQTAELKAAVNSMKDTLQKFESQNDRPNKKEGVTLSEIRQELRSFAAGLHE